MSAAGGRAARTALALTLLALGLSGCETTAEESAKLEKSAKHVTLAHKGLAITRASKQVKVLEATVIHGSEGTAVAVTLHNISPRPLHSVPIAITVADAAGRTLFRNDAPGLEAGLTSIALLPADGDATWIDDQVPSAGGPAKVSVVVGEAPVASVTPPRIEVSGLRAGSEAGEPATGTARNRSDVAQQKLVVYVLARRAGRIVAAGRAIVPALSAGGAASFQAFLVGDPSGGALQASAPPTTLP